MLWRHLWEGKGGTPVGTPPPPGELSRWGWGPAPLLVKPNWSRKCVAGVWSPKIIRDLQGGKPCRDGGRPLGSAILRQDLEREEAS